MAVLSDSAEIAGVRYAATLPAISRSELGQFLTPAGIARLLVDQFASPTGDIRLLDPGAGVGTLTAAFVDRLVRQPSGVNSVRLTAFEIEPAFHAPLDAMLRNCCQAMRGIGVQAEYELRREDFLFAAAARIEPTLFASSAATYTHAILNPPYRKLNGGGRERILLARAGLETGNLYSAFVWLAMLQLAPGGELTAITPRSFCNGAYFRPFRQALLREMALDRIHVFDSRSTAFAADDVLQENVIFHALRDTGLRRDVSITSSEGLGDGEACTVRIVPYRDVVRPGDPESYIHIATSAVDDSVRRQMEVFTSTLSDLGISVSTGPVVDFRLRDSLRAHCDAHAVPLIYPETIRDGLVAWPPASPRKPIAIARDSDTSKWLTRRGWYVLTRRFTSKEERRRVVAAVCQPLGAETFGIENHLNYFHHDGEGIDASLAKGLAAFLNSTLVDNYFRQFSGHTQVNASDLRLLRYPSRLELEALGERINGQGLGQPELDRLVEETLPIMTETKEALAAAEKLRQAVAVLKELGAPRDQQNERSALCLLALADVRPATAWEDAGRPMRRITEMMDWFREHYGKEYKPNTRETVRRATMHQFVQIGFVVENPDEPRPKNSPHWCYQLTEAGHRLITTYGTRRFRDERAAYKAQTVNQLAERRREMREVPVVLPDGRRVDLSAGGQNKLLKAVVEQFCPRFAPGGVVLYLGDAGEKFIVNEIGRMAAMGVELDPHGKMPDAVVHHGDRDWLVLIEAVTSHGPINLKRRNELKAIFRPSGKGLVFVTAFPDRRTMVRYLAHISWETEVWLADTPDHLVHFDGERFLGPYAD